METAASGREVPIETIVRPMITAGNLRSFAIDELPSTKRSAPFTSRKNPPISKTMLSKYVVAR